MSAENDGEIIVTVIEGVLYVAWHAARLATITAIEATRLGYRATRAVVRGTATIVADAQRGRRMRMAADRGDAAAQESWESARISSAGRRAEHERRMAGLGGNARAALGAGGGFAGHEEARLARHFEEQHRRQRSAFDKRCQSIEVDLRAAQDRFDSNLKTLTTSVDRQFVAERQERAREIAAERVRVDRAFEQHRRDLQEQIDEFKRRAEKEAAAADEWIQAAEAEIESVRANSRHDVFCPGELATLESRLEMVRSNRASGLDQAAVAGAQESALQASFVQQKLDVLTARWEAARALAIQSLESGIGALEATRTFELSDVEVADEGEGRTEPGREVDTDHWTCGAWSSRHGELLAALERIRPADAVVDFDVLESLRSAGEAAGSEAVALQVTAKYAIMASLLRADLQSRFAERLADAGYEVIDNAWTGNDERCENHLVLRGVNGDEISIILSPKAGESSFSNRVKVLFRTPDSEPNEQERAERLEDITRILRDAYDLPRDAAFLDCSPGTETNPHAPLEAFDLDRVRAARPAEDPQVRRGG